VGIAATDFASKKAAGVATGFTGTLAYAGAAFTGVPLGMIVDQWGWEGGFAMFIGASLLGSFFFALTWRHRATILEKTPVRVVDVKET
jgi:sugar phosphate permease